MADTTNASHEADAKHEQEASAESPTDQQQSATTQRAASNGSARQKDPDQSDAENPESSVGSKIRRGLSSFIETIIMFFRRLAATLGRATMGSDDSEDGKKQKKRDAAQQASKGNGQQPGGPKGPEATHETEDAPGKDREDPEAKQDANEHQATPREGTLVDGDEPRSDQPDHAGARGAAVAAAAAPLAHQGESSTGASHKGGTTPSQDATPSNHQRLLQAGRSLGEAKRAEQGQGAGLGRHSQSHLPESVQLARLDHERDPNLSAKLTFADKLLYMHRKVMKLRVDWDRQANAKEPQLRPEQPYNLDAAGIATTMVDTVMPKDENNPTPEDIENVRFARLALDKLARMRDTIGPEVPPDKKTYDDYYGHALRAYVAEVEAQLEVEKRESSPPEDIRAAYAEEKERLAEAYAKAAPNGDFEEDVDNEIMTRNRNAKRPSPGSSPGMA